MYKFWNLQELVFQSLCRPVSSVKCLLTMTSYFTKENRLSFKFSSVADPGGGSGPLSPTPPPPIRPDACWTLKFLHRQGRRSLVPFYLADFCLMKHALHFATKMFSRDIKNKIVFGNPSYDLFAKQKFPGILKM